jgi:hypothetical protein
VKSSRTGRPRGRTRRLVKLVPLHVMVDPRVKAFLQRRADERRRLGHKRTRVTIGSVARTIFDRVLLGEHAH